MQKFQFVKGFFKRLGFVKSLLLIIFLFVLCFCSFNCNLVLYGLRQGYGQLHMVSSAVDIDTLLADKDYPDSLKNKLLLIKEIRKFAVDSLTMKESENYTVVYDTEGLPASYVVQACQPYSLKRYLWNFPVVGKLPYKGFFDKEDAEKELQKLADQGYDVRIVNPGGWSTLGWFKDPVLSDMLNRSEASLAELIIHELTHSTIFVKDNSELNENIAEYCGERGAELFLKNKYGDTSSVLNNYIITINRNDRISTFWLLAAKNLDSLYKSPGFCSINDTVEKNRIKRQAINSSIANLDTLGFVSPVYINKLKSGNINNTFFTGFLTYRNKRASLIRECDSLFAGDFLKHLDYLKSEYGK